MASSDYLRGVHDGNSSYI